MHPKVAAIHAVGRFQQSCNIHKLPYFETCCCLHSAKTCPHLCSQPIPMLLHMQPALMTIAHFPNLFDRALAVACCRRRHKAVHLLCRSRAPCLVQPPWCCKQRVCSPTTLQACWAGRCLPRMHCCWQAQEHACKVTGTSIHPKCLSDTNVFG